MDRIGIKSLIVLALLVGGVFELAKRASWPATTKSKDIDAAAELSNRPYARRMLEQEGLHRPRATRQAPSRLALFKATKTQRPLMIPPTEGQFDSHVGQKVANQNQKPQTLDKDKKAAADKRKAWDKKKRFDPERNCLRKRTPEEQDEWDKLMGTGGDHKTAQQKEEEQDEDKIGLCKDDEKVADENKKDDDELDEHPDDERASPAETTVSGGIFTERKDQQLDGLEEWKERLLNQPNFKETVRLIELAQAGQISPALFNKLVELMITDPRPGIQEMGILAAGRTPSFESFHMLIRIVKTENFGSRLRAKAEAELNAYENPRFLPLLERVLRDSSDTFAVVWATRQLEDSARTYLTAKFIRPATPPGPQAGKNPYVPIYQRFVVVLQELSRPGNHPEEISQSRTTLTKIQDLLRGLT